MREILILESIILMISVIFAYLAWNLYGVELINKFGPKLDNSKLKEKDIFQRRRVLGRFSEIFRAIEVYILSLLIFFACTISTTEKLTLSDISQFQWVKWVLILASSLTIVWCAYFGPKGVMEEYSENQKFFSKHVWRKIRLPYLLWIPYIIGVYYLMGGIIILVLGSCASREFTALLELEQLIRSLNGSSLVDIQLGLFKTIQFGRLVSFFSQKYIMVSIFAIAFIFIEQHSYMETTQYLGNLNVLKWGIVIIFLGTIAMSFGYLPTKYLSIHNKIQNMLEVFVDGSYRNGTYDTALTESVLIIQDSLEDYNLNWLYIKNITGYGNILTLSVIGGGLLVQRIFFKDIPFRKLFELLLPSDVMTFWDNLVQNLGFYGDPSESEEDRVSESDRELE